MMNNGLRFQIHHVALSVRHMNEAVEFYSQFGFKEVTRYADPAQDFEIVHMKLDDGFLELWCYQHQHPAPKTAADLSTDLPRIGVKHLALKVPSISEAS